MEEEFYYTTSHIGRSMANRIDHSLHILFVYYYDASRSLCRQSSKVSICAQDGAQCADIDMSGHLRVFKSKRHSSRQTSDVGLRKRNPAHKRLE